MSAWKEANLADYWFGEIERIKPRVGKRADGYHLFYSGCVNMLFGDSTAGKSWVALYISCQEMVAGGHVVYVDLESNARSVVARLKAFGIDPLIGNERFHYVTVSGRYDEAERAEIEGLVLRVKPSLVVIDTLGEAMAVNTLDGAKDGEVVAWMKLLPGPLAQMGPAVVMVDHVGVNENAQHRVAGSFRKRAAVTGAAYQAKQDPTHPHAKGQEGRTALICRKDREGWFALGKTAAVFTLKDDLDGRNATASLEVPTDDDADKPAKTPRYLEVAADLDEWEVPADAGRTVVENAYRERDISPIPGYAVIKKAQEYRRGRDLASSISTAGAA